MSIRLGRLLQTYSSGFSYICPRAKELKTTTSLEELLASIDADELRNLLLSFIERNPRMIFLLEDVAQTGDFNFLMEDPDGFPDEYDPYEYGEYD